MGKEGRTEERTLQNYLNSNYAQIQAMIKHADTKANILLALTGVILSLFFNTFRSNASLPGWQVSVVLTLLFLAGGGALMVLIPREGKPSGKDSLCYYKDAQRADVKKLARKYLTTNQEQAITEDMIQNIRNVSVVAGKKYQKLRIAYVLLGLGILLKTFFEFRGGVLF